MQHPSLGSSEAGLQDSAASALRTRLSFERNLIEDGVIVETCTPPDVSKFVSRSCLQMTCHASLNVHETFTKTLWSCCPLLLPLLSERGSRTLRTVRKISVCGQVHT